MWGFSAGVWWGGGGGDAGRSNYDLCDGHQRMAIKNTQSTVCLQPSDAAFCHIGLFGKF